MIECFESLILLNELGSLSKVALRLSVSQSAISKRIQKLEVYFNEKLVIPKGRQLILSEFGEQIVALSKEHIYALNDLLSHRITASKRLLRLGVSESIISSWGAKVFYQILNQLKTVEVEFHSHRSPFIFHHLETGKYQWGISIAPYESKANLVFTKIAEEPLWILPSRLKTLAISEIKEILCIDSFSSTYKALKHEIAQNKWVTRMELESFNAIAQMAIAGFGHGLIPISTAISLGIPTKKLLQPKQKLSRPIYFICSKKEFASPETESFLNALKQELAKLKFLTPIS